jgi:5'-deoxy-5'-methylthioadenosine phosphorylase
MDSIDLGIIGGTGFDQFSLLEEPRRKVMETRWGNPSHELLLGQLGGLNVAVLNRHGNRQKFPPHKVNYRANVAAMHKLGAKMLLSINAVGGIAPSMGPGALVLPDQIIDYTWGREQTYFDGGEGGLKHIDFSQPLDDALRNTMALAASDITLNVVKGGCYAVTQGPRLETAAEVQRLKQDGNDLIGMTLMPEVVLARELDMRCVNISVVANWGAGLEHETISINEIGRILDGCMGNVFRLCEAFCQRLSEEKQA